MTINQFFTTALAIFAASLPVSGSLHAASADYTSSLSGEKSAADGFTAITLIAAGTTNKVEISTIDRHFTYTGSPLSAVIGRSVKILPTYKGAATKFNFYIDLNQDGIFSEDNTELLASAATANALAGYNIPEQLIGGVYRARLEAVGDCDVDFPVNIHASEGNVYVDVMNGYATMEYSQPLPLTVAYGTQLNVIVTPTLPGFETDKVIIRHGHNLYGSQMIHGNRQWVEETVNPEELATLTAADGDVRVIADFAEQPESEWTAIWSDEFDDDALDTDSWDFHPRYSSTWNKLIAKTTAGKEAVNKFEDGIYKSYSISTPSDITGEDADMITGAIYTDGKFYFKGGRIECRLKTLPHTGNFPAFWMMPHDNTGGWPVGGEIDIWEQIDASEIAYHTIHSGWRHQSFGSVSRATPSPSGSEYNDASLWHVYTLDWTDEELKWYVDGDLKFTYTNQHWSDPYNEKYTEAVTWPFDKPFYVILNQSVGDGSWARYYDSNFDYRTDFDYVRVYQKKDAIDYYTQADGHVTVAIDDILQDNKPCNDTPAEYFNLQGRRVDASALTPGIYICRKGENVTKIVIR